MDITREMILVNANKHCKFSPSSYVHIVKGRQMILIGNAIPNDEIESLINNLIDNFKLTHSPIIGLDICRK